MIRLVIKRLLFEIKERIEKIENFEKGVSGKRSKNGSFVILENMTWFQSKYICFIYVIN